MKAIEKKLKFALAAGGKNWVGNGFHVHTMIRPTPELNTHISPFILLDYAPPMEFTKSGERRGVGEHPHRGFETVTFAYSGEIEHRDSSGGGGVIKPGDVQWMTAGSGIVHDEFHSKAFSEAGGTFEMVQLWVNLPKKNKMTAPKYQGITNNQIPVVKLEGEAELRVIAGNFLEHKGPCSTFTPINIYDVRSRNETDVSLTFEAGTNTLILIMSGTITLSDKSYTNPTMLVFDRDGAQITLTLSSDFKGLVLNGDPIDEPIYAHGPFVMNTKQEILEAMEDYQSGKMGKL